MSAETILNTYFIVFICYVAFEAILLLLNLKEAKSSNGKVPEFLADQIDEETFNRSVSYTVTKGKFALANHFYSALIIFVLIYFGYLGKWYNLWNSWLPNTPYTTSILYILSLSLLMDILSYPFELYSIFKIEASYDFNRMTYKLWIIDKIKGYILSAIIGSLLFYAILWFVDVSGDMWWIYAVSFVIIFELLLMYIYPAWIAPLFNKFTELKNQNLKERIMSLAKKLDFKLADVYEMDGSKRTAHANAYFTGFGKNRRIVLFDTLCEMLSEDEIVAVLAHEIGHQKKKHILKQLCLSCFVMFVMFWAMNCVLHYQPFFEAFGFSTTCAIGVLAIMSFIASPIFYFLTPLTSILSRRFEYQADEFSAKACDGSKHLISALIALSKKSLSNYLPHPFYTFFHYSHPALRERLAALKKFDNNQ